MSLALVKYVPPRHRSEEAAANLATALWTPPTPFAEDLRLANEIRRALLESGYSALRCLSVVVHERAIVLRGAVPSYFMKQMAQEIVKAVCGAQSLTNRLTVRTVENGAE
jgi:osmotically-inducible protein OsmY